MRRGIIFVLVALSVASCEVEKEATGDTRAQGLADAAIPAPSSTQIVPVPPTCPSDMIRVSGDYCPSLTEVCLKWLDAPLCVEWDKDNHACVKWNEPMRCGEFRKPTVCVGNTAHLDFCIDKYEYPNKLGEKPRLRTTWNQAKATCESHGKRLCVDKEWTQACRGPDNLPYPYGYTRDATACRIDLPWQDPATHTFEQLDKTVPSGSMPSCVSEYGVYDMTGNADEWAVSSGGTPYISVFKGGHPHGVRNRCSPRTEGHGPTFSYYDTGFRCCKDAP